MYDNKHVTDWGHCPDCGKIRYPSRKRARQMAKMYPAAHLSPYKCGDFWHLGNLPRAVVRGADRNTLRPPAPRTPAERRTRG